MYAWVSAPGEFGPHRTVTICFVSDFYPTLAYFGGIAVYTRRIARALARRGHQIHVVVAGTNEPADIEDQGVHVHFRRVRWLPVIGRWLPRIGREPVHRRHSRAVEPAPSIRCCRDSELGGLGTGEHVGAGFAGCYPASHNNGGIDRDGGTQAKPRRTIHDLGREDFGPPRALRCHP